MRGKYENGGWISGTLGSTLWIWNVSWSELLLILRFFNRNDSFLKGSDIRDPNNISEKIRSFTHFFAFPCRTSERRVRPIYDINNIVIPYSMLAQSKMEILPYKEIPIPK